MLAEFVICMAVAASMPEQQAVENSYAASATKKLDRDSDGDFLTDKEEINKFQTNPKQKDSDGNGIQDGDEDSNGNGIDNEDEDDRRSKARTRKGNVDTDRDGLANEDENDWNCSSRDSDSDNDGIVDGNDDGDFDGINNEDEDDRAGERSGNEDKDDNGGGGGTTPRPTPTATPQPGNFDSAGNVTAQGKALFGIPSSLSANVNSGKSVHTSKCSGCHGEKTNRSFSFLKTSIAGSPMSITLSDSEVANLTAYLNRFRQ